MTHSFCFTFIDSIIDPVRAKTLSLKRLKDYQGDAGTVVEQFVYRNLGTQIKGLRRSY